MNYTRWHVAANLRYDPHFSGPDHQVKPGAWSLTLRLDGRPAGSPGPEIQVDAYPTYFSFAGEGTVYSIEAQVEQLIRDEHGDVNSYSEITYDERDGYNVFDEEAARDKAGWLAREYGTHLKWPWDGSEEGLQP